MLLTTCEALSPGLGKKVDITPPLVAISSPAPNTYWSEAVKGGLTVSGTTVDDIGVQSLTVSFKNANGASVSKSVLPTEGKWTCAIPTMGTAGASDDQRLADGEQAITVTVADAAGKSSSASIRLYLDNLAPTVMVTSPLTYTGSFIPQVKDSIDIKGEAYDASPVDTVSVSLLKADGSVVATKTAEGTATWFVRFLLDSSIVGSATRETFSYRVTVADKAQNTNSYYFHRADIDAAKTGKIFPSMDAIGKVDQGQTPADTYGFSSGLLALQRMGSGQPKGLAAFVFDSNAAPTVRFTNVNAANAPDKNVLGLGGVITGSITPQAGGGAVSDVRADIYDSANTSSPLVSLASGDANAELVALGDSIGFTFYLKNGSAKLPVGSYLMKVYGTSSGATGSGLVGFMIDAGAPVLKEPKAGLTYARSAFTFGGTGSEASCGGALKEITISESFNNEPGTVVDTVPLGGSLSKDWVSTRSLPTTPARIGTYTYTLTLYTTIAGQEYPLTRSVIWDNQGPTMSYNIVPSYGTTYNGRVNLNATIIDDNAIAAVWYWLQASPAATVPSNDPASASAMGAAGWLPWNGNKNSLSVDFDTTSLTAASGNYNLWVLAVDKCGNAGAARFDLPVDQTQDTPLVSLSGLDPNAAFSQDPVTGAVSTTNLLAVNPAISGSLADDDAIDKSSFRLILRNAVGTDISVPANVSLTGSGKSVGFSYDLAAVDDGIYSLEIQVKDDAAVKGAPAVQTVVGPFRFGIDRAVPNLAIASPVNNLVTGGSFNVLGKAGDKDAVTNKVRNSIVSLTYSIDAALPVPLINPTAGAPNPTGLVLHNFSIPVIANPDHSSDGSHVISLKLTDVFGKVTTANLNYTIDTTAPTLSIVTPAVPPILPLQWLTNSNGAAGGIASDGASGSGVNSVFYLVDGQGIDHSADANPTVGPWQLASGAMTWTAVLNGLTEGRKSLWVVAKDSVGNVSPPVKRDFGVDLALPGATETALGTASPEIGRSGLFNMAGTFTDSNELAEWTLTEKINGSFVAPDGIIATGTVPAVNKNSFAWDSGNTLPRKSDKSIPAPAEFTSSAMDGQYEFTLTVTDVAGQSTSLTRKVRIDTTPPTVSITNPSPSAKQWLLGTNYTINGGSSDGSGIGVEKVYYKINSGADLSLEDPSLLANGWTAIGTASSWSANIDLAGIGEGDHTLWVKAVDAAGNITTAANTKKSVFGVDQNPPILAETGINTVATSIQTAAFDFTGLAGDTNALATMNPLSVIIDGDSAHPVNIPLATVDAGSFPTTVKVTIAAVGGMSDWSAIGGPVAAKAGDSFQPTGNGAGLSGAKVIPAWTYHVTGEGLHTYAFTATDIAGKTTQVNRTVQIDSQPPVLSVTAPGAGAWLNSASYTIKGTGDDGTGTGVNKVFCRVDADSPAKNAAHAAEVAAWLLAADRNTPPSGWTEASGSISWSLPVNLVSLGDGQQKLWVVASDNAGNLTASAATLVFGVDRTAPVLGEDMVGPAAVTRNAGFSLGDSLGTTLDAGSGIASLTVSDNGGLPQAITVDAAHKWTHAVPVNSASHADDGPHSYVFTLTDQAGNQATLVSRMVTIDTTPAVATVNNPAAGGCSNSTTLLPAGSATDGSGSGVKEIWYTVDAAGVDHSADPYSSWTKATGGNSWSHSLSGLTEGAKKFWVKTVDNVGNVTPDADSAASAVSFNIDLTKPTLIETTIGTATVSRRTNFTFDGVASDPVSNLVSSGINSLTVSDNGGTPEAITVTAVTGAWSFTPASPPADGLHNYLFTVIDKAGNQQTMTRSVIVDTTPAVASVTSPSVNTFTNNTVLTVFGSANDGSGSGVDKVYCKITAFATDVSAEDPLVGGNAWTLASGDTAWSASLAAPGEGANKIWVKTVDKVGNWTSAASALAAANAMRFNVDLTAPDLVETLVGTTSTVAKSVTFSFSGTTADPTNNGVSSGVKSLSVSDNGGGAVSIPIASNPWTVTFPISGHGYDGVHTYLFTLTDMVGNQTTMTRSILVDTTEAPATITAPVAGMYSNSSSLAIFGSANDGSGSGVAKVYYKINDGSDISGEDPTVGGNAWILAGGTTAWTATATGLAEGSKKLWVKTIDQAGNQTSAVNALNNAVGFNIDLTKPTLSETAIGVATVSKRSSFTFDGVASDPTSAGVASGVGTLTVSDNGGTPEAITVTAGTGAWSFTPASLPADGTHTYLFTLTDLVGNQFTMTRTVLVDTTAAVALVTAPVANSYSNSGTVTLSGSANDGAGSGVLHVFYKINGGADISAEDPTVVANNWQTASGTSAWTAVSDPQVEGVRKLWVKTEDKAGNLSTASQALAGAVSFNLDLTQPSLTETVIGTASLVNEKASFTIGGSGALSNASDPLNNGVSSGINKLTVSDNGAAPVTLGVDGSGNWSHTVTISDHTYDGNHTYLYTLTDLAGNQSTMTRTILVDTQEASVVVVAPSAASYVSSASPILSGSANDGAGSGVKEVWYYIDTSPTAHAGDAYGAPGWAKASNTSAWSATASGLTEGARYLLVKVLDKAGNYTASASAVDFTVDLLPPMIGETNVGAISAYSDSFTFMGAASDTIALAASHPVQVSIDAGPAADVSGSPAAWSQAITVDTVGHGNDGSHTYAFTATDASGKTASLTRTILIDTQAPAVTYNNISEGSVLQDTNGRISGTLSSASGMAASATCLLEQYSYASGTWSAVSAYNNLALGISAGAKTKNWVVDLGAAKLSDGRYRLSFVVPNLTTPVLTLNTTASPVSFFWSRGNPLVSVSAPGLGAFQNGDFPVAGTTFDASLISSVKAKFGSGAVDFSSGATDALPALGASLDVPTSTFTTARPHGLINGDGVHVYASPMPTATINGVQNVLSAGTTYYVAAAGASTFSLRDGGGNAVTINSNTATSLIVASSKFTYVPTAQTVTVTSGSADLHAAVLPLVGQAIGFVGGTVPDGMSGSTMYYVVSVNSGSSSFQIALTTGGTAVIPASSGSPAMSSPVNWLIPNMSVGSLSDGSQTVYVQVASTNSQKSASTSRDFTLDRTGPSISLTSPVAGTRSVGNLLLTGTSTDPGSIPSGVTGSIQYQIGKNYNLGSGWSTANVTGGAYSWSINLGDMSSFANGSFATECNSSGLPAAGTNLWRLPIVFQAVDKAGNTQQKTDYFLILDPDGNIPVITITQPSNGLTVGGQVRISGTASQPVWIHDIEVSEDPTNTGTFTTWKPATLVTTGNNVIWYYDINKTGEYPQSGNSQTVQVMVRGWNSPVASGGRGTISGLLTNPLTMTFNSTFPKVQGITVNGASYYSQIVTRGTVSLSASVSSSKGIGKIEAVESSPLAGSTSLYDTSVSFTGSAASKGSYWTSTVTAPTILTAGTFPFGGAYKLLITSLGSTDWTAIGAPPAAAVGTVFTPSGAGSGDGKAIASDAGGSFNYTVNMTIATTSLYSNTSGQYAFDFRVTDLGSPAQVSTTTVTLNEDNYYPTTTISKPDTVPAGSFLTGSRYIIASLGSPATDFTAVGALSNTVGLSFVATGAGSGNGTALPVLTGSTQKIQGTATDVGGGSGPLSGLSKVVVYLTNPAGTKIYDIKTGGASVDVSSQTAKDMANSGTIGSVPYPDTSAYSKYFASIDTITENGSSDANGDGFLESFLINGNARDWWAQIDTTILPDGPVTIHEVIWDSAGNPVHYAQAAFIANRPPVLGSVSLGTDLNGDSTIDSFERVTPANASLTATGFVAHNSLLEFTVNLAPPVPATTVWYSIQYLTQASGMFSGKTYVIDDPGTVNWTSIGAGSPSAGTSFVYNGGAISGSGTALLYAAPQTGNTLTISDFSAIPDSLVANDRVFKVFVYDSAAGTSPGVTSQNFVQTVNLTLKNVDQNAPAGSFTSPYWNSTGDNSLYQNSALNGHIDLNGGIGNPKVSGKIRFQGMASDDQRIQYLRMKITGTAITASSTVMTSGKVYVIDTVGDTNWAGIGALTVSAGSSFTYNGAGVTGSTGKIRGGFDLGSGLGAWAIVGTWDGISKTLVGTDNFTSAGWKFSIGSESLSASGHAASWTLEWDTARIKNGADTGVTATIEIQDFRNTGVSVAGTANATQYSTTVDVVPYISDISHQAPFGNRLSDNTMNPGKDGYYPLYQGATGVVVSGFNLPNSTSQDAANWIKVGSTALTLTAAASTRDSLTVTVPSSLVTAGGGSNADLTITTNGIASINNTNGNGYSYNTVAESGFTDDRKIYIDEQAPTIVFAPFGQKYPNVDTDDTTNPKTLGAVDNYNDNIKISDGTDGYVSGAREGHVEYAGDSLYNAGTADISGKVIFKGKAADNQRISRITATIQGYNVYAVTLDSGTDTFTNTGNNGLVANTPVYFTWTTAPGGATNGQGPYYVVGTPTATTFQVSATVGGSAVNFSSAGAGINASLGFDIYAGGVFKTGTDWSASVDGTDYLIAANRVSKGHVLNWSFTWDSSKIASVAAANVPIFFNAFDANMVPQTNANTLDVNCRLVDIVPYISAITNPTGQGLSSDVLRSSTGKYSLEYSTSNKFNVIGFNLGAAATYTPSSYITTAPVSTTPTATATGPQNPATTFGSSVLLQVAKTMTMVKSGYLTVFVNGVPSLNNLNKNAAMSGSTAYNKEIDVTKPYSTQWNDDRYLWFWKQTQLNGAAFNSQTYNYPDMVMSGNQPIFTYDNDNNGFNYRTTSDTVTVRKAGLFYERLGALAVNQDGTTPTWFIMSTEDAFGGSGIGNLMINKDVSNFGAQGVNSGTYTNNNDVYEIINEDYGARTLNRFKYPRLIAEGTNTATQLYASVFDNYSKLIYFISFQTTGAGADNMTEVSANGGIATNGIVALSGTAGTSSQSFAMTKIGTGTNAPIAIAYYDPSSSTLKLTYSSNHTASNLANGSATWTTKTIDANLYNGSDVSMTNDGTYLYLSYYDSANADLRFARITWSTIGNTSPTISTYTIDSYLSVGTWTNISLINGVPYIAYYTASFNGTIKPMKIAFPTDGAGGVSTANISSNGADAASDNFTGTWEAITVPAVTAPVGGQEQFNHTQLGLYANNLQNLPVVGWLGSTLEYAKLQPNN